MTARNAPCPCGSGKQFKHCHGLARTAESRSPTGHELAEQVGAALAARRWDEAIAHAERAPAGPARSRWLAHALLSRRGPGDRERARDALADWSRHRPRDAEPFRRLLELELNEQRRAEAGKALAAFAARTRADGDVAYYEGILKQLEDSRTEALAAYGRAAAIRRAASGRAPLAEPERAVAAAMLFYETAAGNYPGSPERALEGMFDQQAAVATLENALLAWEQAQPGAGPASDAGLVRVHADAWYNIGCAAMAGFAGHELAIRRFRKAAALDGGHVLARLNAVFALNYSDTATPAEIYAAHRETGRWLEGRCAAEAPALRAERRERRLRLGYLSSDFRTHSVAHFIVPVLEAHDADRFEVFAYYTHHREDEVTARVRQACSIFRAVAELTDGALRQRFVDDGIDVLIDLNGLTERNRMTVLAMRAAPVQMSWIGYPNTTGLSSVDFRIVDAVTDPPGSAEAFATERLLRMPQVFSVYGPPADAPAAQRRPVEASGAVTFGSFNALPKLNEALLRVWAKILLRLPGSRLLLKNSALRYRAPRERIAGVLARCGIGAERLEFAGHTPGQREHLEHYHRVDISLDTHPYNGTTTTCESLYMGVPVVARAGTDHRSRVALSQLRAVGLESLVASDENTFVTIAADLAADPVRLAALSSGLRERMLSSPLTDARAFTRSLEDAVQRAWEESCRQKERS